MKINKLTNIELTRLCAQEPADKNVWKEFYSRFDKRIWLVIYRECREKGFTENTSQFRQIVQDLVQEVYVKLVDKNCKALRDFIGASEHSIFTYLGIIAKNVVRNYLIKMNAQKRPSKDKSINETFSISGGSGEVFVEDFLKSSDSNAEKSYEFEILKDEIDEILEKFLKGKDKERNKLIFKMCIYEGFSPKEIASKPGFSVTTKTVGNIVSKIKKELRKELFAQKVEVY